MSSSSLQVANEREPISGKGVRQAELGRISVAESTTLTALGAFAFIWMVKEFVYAIPFSNPVQLIVIMQAVIVVFVIAFAFLGFVAGRAGNNLGIVFGLAALATYNSFEVANVAIIFSRMILPAVAAIPAQGTFVLLVVVCTILFVVFFGLIYKAMNRS